MSLLMLMLYMSCFWSVLVLYFTGRAIYASTALPGYQPQCDRSPDLYFLITFRADNKSQILDSSSQTLCSFRVNAGPTGSNTYWLDKSRYPLESRIAALRKYEGQLFRYGVLHHSTVLHSQPSAVYRHSMIQSAAGNPLINRKSLRSARIHIPPPIISWVVFYP